VAYIPEFHNLLSFSEIKKATGKDSRGLMFVRPTEITTCLYITSEIKKATGTHVASFFLKLPTQDA